MANAGGAIGVSILLLSGSLQASASQDPREYELKAAWLYNFAANVEWPATAFAGEKAPVVFCVYGRDPFAGGLEKALQSKTIAGRAIRLRKAAAPAEAAGCHLLFVPDTDQRDIGKIAEALGTSPVLVVGESEGLATRGAILNFFREDNRLRFEANLKAASRAGLSVGSKLLKFARIVKEP